MRNSTQPSRPTPKHNLTVMLSLQVSESISSLQLQQHFVPNSLYYLFVIMSPQLDCQHFERLYLNRSNSILYPMTSIMPGTKQLLNKCCTNKWSQSSAYWNPTHLSRPLSFYRLDRPLQSRVITASFELKLVGSAS